MDRRSHTFSILPSPARRVLVAVGFLICISTVSVATAGEYVSRHKLQNLLRQGEFNALEQTLAGLERSYKAGRISDDVIDHAYYAFASADPDFASQFTKWIAAKPRSHRALIARGMFRRNLGWVFRGDAIYSRLPQRSIDQMIRLFKVAEQDMNAALALKPNSGVAYGYLIEMQIAAGSKKKRDDLLQAGLKVDPNSRAIRQKYFFGMLPWWGGGRSTVNDPNYPVALPDALRRFATSVERDAASRPDLQPLRGYLDFTAAEILHREGRYQEAAEYFNRALSFGDLATFHEKAGQNYYRLQRYDDAIASFDRALELRPDVPGYLKWRSWTYGAKGQFEKSLEDLNAALAVDRKDPELLLNKGKTLAHMGHPREAMEAFNDALFYGDADDEIWFSRGSLYLYQFSDPKQAAKDLKRARKLAPGTSSYLFHYWYARVLSWR